MTMIDRFLDYLRYERNMSPLTVSRYEQSLRQFETYYTSLEGQVDWTAVDADIIRDWMASQLDDGKSATTINTNLSAVRSFYRFALIRKLVSRDPAHQVEGPKKPKALPKFMRESEMNELLDGIEWSDSYKDKCTRTLLITFYETGLRLSELTGLNDEDIDFASSQLKVTGKRNKQRVIPFGKELAEALLAYKNERDRQVANLTNAFFVSEKGVRLTNPQVYHLVHKYLSMVTTQKKRSPHVLRHTFATAMLNHQAGLESVKKLLGHESLETTQIYTHTTFEQLRRVYKEAHPRA